MQEITSRNINDLPQIAKTIIEGFKDYRIFLFEGNLGSGKTTLIKEIVKQLDAEDEAISPTFSILNIYKSTQNGEIYHFDLYRIQETDELIEIGFEDYILSGNYCFIEWPQLVEEFLEKYVKIKIEAANNKRIYKIEAK